MTNQSIELKGVQTHNLKNIDVNFPLGQISIVTGVSGSGKSSLVFDTLYGESYRRYVESLSSFARQYMKALPKPEIQSVKNLPPSVAVKQLRSKATSRSTVGTMTELVDLLRIIITHAGNIQCINCGEIIEKDNSTSIVKKAFRLFAAGQQIMILASLKKFSGTAKKELKTNLIGQGFKRYYNAKEVQKIEEVKGDLSNGYVVVDRITVNESQRGRLEESISLALKLSQKSVGLVADDHNVVEFSDQLECLACKIMYSEPSPARMSFNHPLGACQTCNGFGLAAVMDEEKIIPDETKSLNQKGVAPWNFGKHTAYYKYTKDHAKKIKLSPEKPFKDYTVKERRWLFEGTEDFEGIRGYFAWLDSKRYKPHYRIHAARYRKYVICETCSGARLKPEALAYKINGKNIHELCSISLSELADFVRKLKPEEKKGADIKHLTMGVGEALKETEARLNYLQKVGLSYLTLDRTTRTLSGGEFQRINMARCLGNALTESLFCLDEPSCGLHPRDSDNLLSIIKELRDQGNTVVVVEHEKQIINGADYIFEIGPRAGHLGGELTFAGPSQQYKFPKVFQSVIKENKLIEEYDFLEVSGVRIHNLKNVNCQIPVGALTGICGVSGSGKTSLIQHSVYPLLARTLGQEVESQSWDKMGSVKPTKLVGQHSQVMLVSQAALGRSSRSNIATYLGIYDDIRKVLADTSLARKNKLSSGSFSFNVPGGRCENCRGLGTVTEDLSFLGEMNVICPECEGYRFKQKILDITYKGKNVNNILKLTVDQAREFFHDTPKIATTLDAVVKMGLGYLALGQMTSSFSGGEAQRLKLVSLVKEASHKQKSILIFDEPSTGLSDSDVYQLVTQMKFLTSLGHTILVIEHHSGFLKSCDWLIEIGPEAGDAGGEVIYQGPPEKIFSAKQSRTAAFLQ